MHEKQPHGLGPPRWPERLRLRLSGGRMFLLLALRRTCPVQRICGVPKCTPGAVLTL